MGVSPGARYQRRHRAALGGIGNEFMAVDPLAHQGDEERTFNTTARVVSNTRELRGGIELATHFDSAETKKL